MNIQPFSLIVHCSQLLYIAALAPAQPAQAMALALELPAVPGALRLRALVARKAVRCHRQDQLRRATC